jgi:SulP family sulfate permease
MLALTFFGVLHVPINVPALALQTGEDHADLDHELKLHGLSNFLSGCAGSIQNYLVYANSQFFIKSGGNTRLAGYLLAVFTGIVMVIGPVLIGYIPVMMVGTLIFVLGFELLLDALWAPRKKLNWLEYLTVNVIPPKYRNVALTYRRWSLLSWSWAPTTSSSASVLVSSSPLYL